MFSIYASPLCVDLERKSLLHLRRLYDEVLLSMVEMREFGVHGAGGTVVDFRHESVWLISSAFGQAFYLACYYIPGYLTVAVAVSGALPRV